MSSCDQDIQFIYPPIGSSAKIKHSNIKKLFLSFKKTNNDVYVYDDISLSSIKIRYERSDEHLYTICLYYVQNNKEKVIFNYMASVVNEYVHIFLRITYFDKHLSKFSDNPPNSFIKNINKILNKNYKNFQNMSSKQEETKPQNTQEIQPQKTITPEPTFSCDELSFKEFSIQHLGYYIPNGLREIIKIYGDALPKNQWIKRCVDLNAVSCRIILRKNKSKSVLRFSKIISSRFELKIGLGNNMNTSQVDKFDWRVGYNEENLQLIKNAFIELNKWYKEKRQMRNKELMETHIKDNFKPLE